MGLWVDIWPEWPLKSAVALCRHCNSSRGPNLQTAWLKYFAAFIECGFWSNICECWQTEISTRDLMARIWIELYQWQWRNSPIKSAAWRCWYNENKSFAGKPRGVISLMGSLHNWVTRVVARFVTNATSDFDWFSFLSEASRLAHSCEIASPRGWGGGRALHLIRFSFRFKRLKLSPKTMSEETKKR
jgi:hypothetical protein